MSLLFLVGFGSAYYSRQYYRENRHIEKIKRDICGEKKGVM